MNELQAVFSGDLTTTSAIEKLEEKLGEVEEELVLTIDEVISDGMYMRVGYFPAGIVGTAAVHVSDFLNIMVSGKMLVASEKGNMVVEGFDFYKSHAGEKKAFYILEDTIFISIDKVPVDEIDGDMRPHYTVKGMKEYNELIGVM